MRDKRIRKSLRIQNILMTKIRNGTMSLMHNYDFEHASFESTDHFMVATVCLLCAAYFCSPCKQDKYALYEQNTYIIWYSLYGFAETV